MGPSIWQLLIILVIVMLLFGTKRMRTLGSDLGSAIKGFRKAVNDGDKSSESSMNGELGDKSGGQTIDVEVTTKEKEEIQ